MDNVSSQTRSRMMAGIRGSETKPERMVRTALFSRGFRYRKNCGDLPGRPDLKLSKYNAVIFVHGCFWHGHNCRYYKVPSSNTDFWTRKIDINRKRDASDVIKLRASGWRICIVWECVTRNFAALDSWLAVVNILSEWIAGIEPFLELYDKKAMHMPPDIDKQNVYVPGSNTEEDIFVAERLSSY